MNSDNHPIHETLLKLVHEHRFATTHQLMRLTKHHYGSQRSALRQTLRHLSNLQGQQLITHLERRVGGWQGGSQITIWTLTTRGERVLTGNRRRLFPHRYSTTFLEHQLAATEAVVILRETTRAHDLKLSVEAEPQCWRTYLSTHGISTVLKPDLAVTITSDEYVDKYFIEVDRATENPARVVRKCWQYEHHWRSGTEQKRHGFYPMVVWLVPHEHRKLQLLRALAHEPNLTGQLFTVVVVNELPNLIRDGPPATG